MSDSEAEFESADEGSKGDDGWDIETDFDLPDLEYVSTEKESSILSKTSKVMDTVQSLKCKVEDLKPFDQNYSTGDISTLQSGFEKSVVNNDNINSKPLVSEENKIIQNEAKQSSVSKNILLNYKLMKCLIFKKRINDTMCILVFSLNVKLKKKKQIQFYPIILLYYDFKIFRIY